MQLDVASRSLDFVWTHQPDLALEAGRLPPVLWEQVSEPDRTTACEIADSLLAEMAALPAEPVLDVARYHVVSARSLIARHSLDVLNHMTGPAARLGWAVESWPVAADPGADMYIERLKAFPAYCADIVAEGARSDDDALSRPVLEAFVSQVDAMVDAHRSGAGPLLRPVRASGGTLPAEVLGNVLTALLTLRAVAVAAIPASHAASPMSHLPDGAERYAEAIFRGASLSLSPERLAEMGHSILRDSRDRFAYLQRSDAVSFDPLPSGGVALERVARAYARLNAAIPSVCSASPIMPCEVVEMPETHAAVGPPAYYGPSSRHNGRPGSLYVNTADPVTMRDWEVLPLSMHEGVPGHHLQLALLDENESIPDVLRLLSVNAFTEGWAVYAETLAPSMGLELSPSDEFGLLAHQRWRAARLVVDVGLHVHGWSIDEAVTFLADQTRQDRRAVQREVIRYVSWPGQALGYAVGANVVASWVAARRAEGVPLADAHAELLALGSVPLSALVGGAHRERAR